MPFTSNQIRRSFKVLTAIGSYAASYREAKKDGETIDEKTRAEERKKALESVIDAFTDRSSRKGELVWSLGANVGFQFALMHSLSGPMNDNGKEGGVLGNVFTLPMGVAAQWYPANSPVGFHGMLILLDPAQYLTVNDLQATAKFADPTPLTAVHLGVQGGIHFGNPNFPIVVSGRFGWSPELRLYKDEANTELTSQSVLVFGLLNAGIYVPFFDFN